MDVYASTYGKVLTGLTVIAAVLAVGGVVASGDLRSSLLAVAFGGLIAGASWALFWRPRVELDDAGVTVVNVVRTIHVPWPLVVDAEAGWSLVVVTPRHRWTAWAAPRASSSARALQSRPDRPPAPPSRASAQVVSAAIRSRQEAMIESGALDGARRAAEEQGIGETLHWHLGTIAGGLALFTLAGVAATL